MGLTEHQLDGLACVICGLDAKEAGPMVPAPVVGGRQVFRCAGCDEWLERLAADVHDLHAGSKAILSEMAELGVLVERAVTAVAANGVVR